jgi:hypothetical protein
MRSTEAGIFSRRAALIVLSAAVLGGGSTAALAQTDPLRSWNEGATKQSITDFVTRVTTQGGADFVPSSCNGSVGARVRGQSTRCSDASAPSAGGGALTHE